MIYCEIPLHPKRDFDRRSFRWKKIKGGKGAKILIGCPRGEWQPRKARCKVGTRGYKLLIPAGSGRCKRGGRRISK
jgi:hypothetical protein